MGILIGSKGYRSKVQLFTLEVFIFSIRSREARSDEFVEILEK